MSQYFTEIEIPDAAWRISYQDRIMMLGSCFVENIGHRMEELKFQVDLNPFGILYNPKSIAQSLLRLINLQYYQLDDLFEDQGVWNSFDHHSRFSSTDPNEALAKINDRLSKSHEFLKSADYLFVTFGTSWVYELNETRKIVSNCHKIPASKFNRFRLGIDDIIAEWQKILQEINKFNPKLRILFTVSPIRHWKDGAVENQRSKSTLLLAAEKLIEVSGQGKCVYFPSYEIVMDELRDYRFYAADMFHLNEVAIDHIWDKFMKIMISEETNKIVKDVIKLNKAFNHRPLNSTSETYHRFLLYNLKEIEKLMKIFPFLNFSKEQLHFEQELSDSQWGVLKS